MCENEQEGVPSEEHLLPCARPVSGKNRLLASKWGAGRIPPQSDATSCRRTEISRLVTPSENSLQPGNT